MSRGRQYPSVVALHRSEIPTGALHKLLLSRRRKSQDKGKRIALSNRSGSERLCRRLGFQRGCEVLQVGRDGDNLTRRWVRRRVALELEHLY